MKAAIIGATGLIGHALLTQLVNDQRYQTIYVIGRRPAAVSSDKITFIQKTLAQWSDLNLPSIDHAYCALGSTLKKAGSQEQFHQIDCVAIVEFAKQCQAHKTFVVSSLGAKLETKNFYLRTKGEMEAKLTELALPHLTLVRPSLLLGKREQIRPLEALGQTMANIFGRIMPKAYRPVSHLLVANCLISRSKLNQTEPVVVIENAALFNNE
jgi:uncharacterized protein YbjT (DUF2867 family)